MVMEAAVTMAAAQRGVTRAAMGIGYFPLSGRPRAGRMLFFDRQARARTNRQAVSPADLITRGQGRLDRAG
jgi:hypothetical protein